MGGNIGNRHVYMRQHFMNGIFADAPLLHHSVCPAQPKMITGADCEVLSAQDWKSLIASYFGAKLKIYLTWVASIFYCQMIKKWKQFGMLNVDVTRSSWLSCALRGDEAVYWVSIVPQWLVLVGLYKVSIRWYWLDPDGTGSVWGMHAFIQGVFWQNIIHKIFCRKRMSSPFKILFTCPVGLFDCPD